MAQSIALTGAGTLFGRHRLAHQIIVIRLNHHDFRTEGRNFKSVIITHQHQVFALETSNSSASRGVEEAHFIAYIHKSVRLVWSKDTKKPLDLRL